MSLDRRMVAYAAMAVAALTAAIAACSDDRPPGAGDPLGGTSGSSGTSGTSSGTSGSGGDASGDDDDTVDGSSSSSGGDGDAAPDGPVFQCVGDTSIEADGGGALPTACADSATCRPRCEQLEKNFKVGTAQTGVACLRKLSSCENGAEVSICVAGAVDATCSDATATTFCNAIVKPCDPNAGELGSIINQPDCENLVKALNAEGRTTFKACIDQKISAGTCAQEVGECIGALQ